MVEACGWVGRRVVQFAFSQSPISHAFSMWADPMMFFKRGESINSKKIKAKRAINPNLLQNIKRVPHAEGKCRCANKNVCEDSGPINSTSSYSASPSSSASSPSSWSPSSAPVANEIVWGCHGSFGSSNAKWGSFCQDFLWQPCR